MAAGNNVTIEAASNTSRSTSFAEKKESGFLSGSGFGISYGNRDQSTDNKDQNTTAAASTVGSIEGNVNINAGQAFRQVGSDVVAPAGDIHITAQKVDIVEARETSNNQTEQKFKQSGFTLEVTSPVLSALQTVSQMAQAAGNTSSPRMKALAGANAGFATNNAANAIQAGQGSLINGKEGQIATQVDDKGKVLESRDATAAEKTGGINVSLSFGSSSSQNVQRSQSDSARGSSVTAGGKVVIAATGAGQASDLAVRASTVQAGQSAVLLADNHIQLLAAQNTANQAGTSKSSSSSIGVSYGTDGLLLNLSASGAKGKLDGSETSYSNAHINAGQVVVMQSGGDTTLKGAVVQADTVIAQVGGNLTLESLQDTSTYASKNQSLGGSVSVGYGKMSGSLSASQSKIDSNFKSVAEQSAILAGDGGFEVRVKGNTDLKGGAIVSTDKAIADNKNRLTTATLTSSDIQNRSEASASSSGINLSSDMLSQGKYGVAKAVLGNALGNASASGSSSSQTKSAVSAATVTITDGAAQQASTGNATEKTMVSLNRDTAGAHTAAQKQDVQAMLRTVEAERVIKEQTIKMVATFTDETYRSRFKETPKFFKIECLTGANCAADPSQLRHSPATAKEVAANASADTVMAVNGIFNNEKRAVELAYQNAAHVDKTNQNPDGNKPTIYLMHVKPANNALSELMGVAYEKATNSMDYGTANFFGYTNAVETYAGALSSREDKGTNSLGHSRGTLVQNSSFTALANRPDESGKPYTNPNLTVRGVGGAADAQSYTEAAVKITGEKARDNITYNYFSNDPVSTSKFSGGNPGGWTLKDLWQVYDTTNSMHSCYGSGGKGCVQVEAPVRNGPQGTPDGNARLIRYEGGTRVNSNLIGRDAPGGAK